MRLHGYKQGIPDIVSVMPLSCLTNQDARSVESFRRHVEKLPREETLSIFAKLNLMSTFAQSRGIKDYQNKTLKLLYVQNWIEPQDYSRLRADLSDNNPFYGRQNCLELIRWTSLWGSPSSEGSSNDLRRMRAFSRSLLTAFEFWTGRTQIRTMCSSSYENGSDQQRQFEALRAFRENQVWAVPAGNPLWQFGRSRELYLDIFFANNPNLQKHVEATLGFGIEDYITCVIGLASLWDSWFQNPNVGIVDNFEINPLTIGSNIPHMKGIFERFLLLESQTANDLKSFYQKTESCPAELTELKPLRERPILSFANNQRATFIDFNFLIERASNGLLFKAAGLPGSNAMQKFGDAFEKYAADRLDHYAQNLAANGINTKGHPNVMAKAAGEKSPVQFSDFALVSGDSLLLFEIKGCWLREGIVSNFTAAEYWSEICQKYVCNTGEGKEKRKGVSQLVDSITGYVEGRLTPEIDLSEIKTIIPVLLVFDRELPILFHGTFLALEMRKLLPKCDPRLNVPMKVGQFEVLDLCLMSIDEFEQFENRILKSSMNQLLLQYSKANPYRELAAGPFLTSLTPEPFAPERPIVNRSQNTLNEAAIRLFGKALV